MVIVRRELLEAKDVRKVVIAQMMELVALHLKDLFVVLIQMESVVVILVAPMDISVEVIMDSKCVNKHNL